MSQFGGKSPSDSSGTAIGSPTNFRDSREKYAVVSEQQSYPELAPQINQPALQHYQQPNNQSPSQYQQPNTQNYGTPNQYQYPQTPAQEAFVPQAQQKRNPWGMSPLAFGLLVALITALVVGAAVGGGVAGAMSGKDDNSSSDAPVSTVTVTRDGAGETATPTSGNSATTTSAVTIPSSLKDFTVPEPYYVATLDDPGCQTSRIDVQYDERYDLSCGLNYGNGDPSQEDSSKVVADFVGLFAYSITDCLYACANANHFTKTWNQDHDGGVMQLCKAVTWAYDMAANNASNSANCWLKNGTSAGYQCNTCISGVLVE